MKTRFQSLTQAVQMLLSLNEESAAAVVKDTRVGKLAGVYDPRILTESLANNLEELFDELSHKRKYQEQSKKVRTEQILLTARDVVNQNYEAEKEEDRRIVHGGYKRLAVSDIEVKNYYKKIQKRSVRKIVKKNNIVNRTKGAL